MWFVGMIRMCVGACGLMSRNATTVSVRCTTSASTSPDPILQKRQSLAVSAIWRSNLTEPAVPGEHQRRADDGGGLGTKDRSSERDDHPTCTYRRDPLSVSEATFGSDQHSHARDSGRQGVRQAGEATP